MWYRLVWCVPLMSIGWTVSCDAADSLGALLACRNIPEASARLACFDRAAAGGTGMASAPSPSPSPVAAPAPALDAQQQFGLPEKALAAKEVAAGTRAAETTKIQAHVAGLSRAADGTTVFALDNDQVWKQLSVEGELLARLGDGATVSRALLGSYWLQLSSGRGCKVTRLR